MAPSFLHPRGSAPAHKGQLTLISGPMFAGKSSMLIKMASRTSGKKALFKPHFDKRYGDTEIVTHDGKRLSAFGVKSPTDFMAAFDCETIFIDEVQFLEAPLFSGDLPPLIATLLKQGISVVCAGLNRTWQDKPFALTEALADMADSQICLMARCAVCGAPATKSFKKCGTDQAIELGAADLYEPRCPTHFYNFPDAAVDSPPIEDGIQLFPQLPPASEAVDQPS